jgi:hypothetical protein
LAAHDVQRSEGIPAVGRVCFQEAIMRGKHFDTLTAVFREPVSGSIKWRDIEALLISLGAEVSEGSGSRVRFTMKERTLFLHRPHPSPDTRRWAVREIRSFLTELGIKP